MRYSFYLCSSISRSLQIHSKKWANYSNKIILWIIHLIYIQRSRHLLQIYASKWAKYSKKIIVWIIRLMCIDQSRVTLNLFWKWAKYSKKIVLWIIRSISIGPSRSSQNLFYEVRQISEENHTMNYSFDLYWSIMIHSKSMLRNERNIRRKSYFQLFFWSMSIDHGFPAKSIRRSERNIRRKSYYELFVWSVLFNHDPIQIYSKKWAKYWNKILLWIICIFYA